METTSLSTIIARMSRYRFALSIEDGDKVNDLDEALRNLKRVISLPFWLKKNTLRVFQDVLEYPIAEDHDEIAYLDDPKYKIFQNKPNFYYTSIKEFYENPNDRNDLCEIFDSGVRYLGVRYDTSNVSSQLLDTQKNTVNYTASQDASDIAIENVIFQEDNSSIRFTNTISSGVAKVVATFNTDNDSLYKQKYFFVWAFLTGIPTSIELRLQTDSSNYLTTTITKQFSGQSFKINNWNLLAIDLSTATQVGTFNSLSIKSYVFIMNGAPTGFYYLDNAYLRQWTLLDYWYYSKYAVITNGSQSPDQEFFRDNTEVYKTDSALVGDKEWADVVMFKALEIEAEDLENDKILLAMTKKKEESWQSLKDKYPDMVPLITTTKYDFNGDYFQSQWSSLNPRN